jgi:hypothetical protein
VRSRRGVRRGVAIEPLGHRARAGPWREDQLDRPDLDAELLGGLPADRGLRVVVVQQAGGGLDEQTVGVAVDVHGEAELAGEQHGLARDVEEQDRRAVAAVVGLPLLGGPATVAVALLEGGPAQDVPAAGQELDVGDDDVRVAGEVAAHPVQAGAAPGVRDVDAGGAHAAGTSATSV